MPTSNIPQYRILFPFPNEEVTSLDVIYEILETHQLKETDEEYIQRMDKGQEPKASIVKDAAIALFEKKAPEDTLAPILAKHLGTTIEIAQKVIADIKTKLLPYAKKAPLVSENEEDKLPPKQQSTQEILIEKIKSGTPTNQSPAPVPAPLAAGQSAAPAAPPVSVPAPAQAAPTPQPVKQVNTPDVEENAEKLKQERSQEQKSGTVGAELPRKGQSDKYRESFE